LRDYNNQRYYSHLKRGPVANFLEALRASLNEIEDSLPGVGEVVAIDRPRWLMQQISQARHEVIMVVDQITRQSPIGESKMWLELLQELLVRGVRVQLYLTSLPFATPKKPESLLITKQLQLLLDRGVSVWLTEERPAWRVIIDARTEVPRALKLATDSFIFGQNTGKNGLLSTIHPQAVTLIRDEFDLYQARARQVKAEELKVPPEVEVINLKRSEKTSEKSLFGELFSQPVKELSVNDRYLVNEASLSFTIASAHISS
jgi:hypothetical protein